MNDTASILRPTTLDRASIDRLVHDFYDDVRNDEVLRPTFEAVLGERWSTHLPRMVEFWSTLMLSTRSFSGNVFGTHMAVPGVTPLHFRRWLALWQAHTGAAFDATTTSELQQVARGIARNLYRGYFGQAASFDGIESELEHASR